MNDDHVRKNPLMTINYVSNKYKIILASSCFSKLKKMFVVAADVECEPVPGACN